MNLIEEVLLSDEVFKKKFVCDLSRCKGACCWEGDFGAPLEKEEEESIPPLYDILKNYLSQEAQDHIRSFGYFDNHPSKNQLVTPILGDGACVYLCRDERGIARCSFEIVFEKGLSSFKKPISCHLYPLRITKNERTGFEAINYDEWDICSPACNLGEKLSIPVYRFVQEAIIRKYGHGFYRQIEELSRHLNESQSRQK